jgi:DNA-binding CsgD family transcriptional regulator
LAREASETGARFGDADLIAFGQNLQGRALLAQGRVEEGIALLDESMLGSTTGELSPVVTGLIYCSTIVGCNRVYAFDRAREWTATLSAWCDAQPQLVPFAGSCLVHRSEILQLGGDWAKASAEAELACERSAGHHHAETAASAFYQAAELHRLRGEFEEAEIAYGRAAEFGRDPQPGLALLRLGQGRADAALTAIRRAVGASNDRLLRARLLPAFVEILLASGTVEEAASACRELEEIAAVLQTEVLGAIAAHARGAVHLAQGDARAALEPLRHAFRVWHDLGAPYLAARLRVLVARACRELGDADSASLELGLARQVFERLGAGPDLAAITAPENPSVEPPQHGLTPRELQVLCLVASGKTNKTIAAELGLSEKTVDRHVSNIFVKANVSSRAAATAYAYEHGLV